MPPYSLNHRPGGEDRRGKPRWEDKRLLILVASGSEYPGVTADISLEGMRLALPRCPAVVGRELTVRVAFAQEVIEIRGRVAYTRARPWGVLAGLLFTPGQEEMLRFVARRYPALAAPCHPPHPGPGVRSAPTRGNGRLDFQHPQ